MKPKLIIMALLCAISWDSYAQLEKGSGFAGLGLSFGSSKFNANSPRVNTFTATPRGGYFFTRRLAVGLELPFNLSRLRNERYIRWNSELGQYEDANGPKELSFGISPFLRAHLYETKRFRFFAQANTLLQLNTFNQIDADGYLIKTDARVKGYGGSLSPGITYILSPDSSLDFSFPVITFFHQNYYDPESRYNYEKTNNIKVAPQHFIPTVAINFNF